MPHTTRDRRRSAAPPTPGLPSPLATTLALGLCFAAVTPALTAQSEEIEAVKAFTAAEALAAKGKYRAASSAYKSIAKKYSGTSAGMLALQRSGDTAFLGWSFLVENGPSENRIDVVVFGEAFTLAEQNRFDDMAKRIPKDLESREVFEEYYAHHNFIRANVISKDKDIDSHGREYETAFDGQLMGRNEPFFVVSRGRVHEALANLPSHDGLAIVLTKAKGMGGTGGAGVAAAGAGGDDLVNHEWGHAFGGLADEYTTFTHDRGDAVGRAPNLSDTDDPKRVSWSHWLEADAPGVGIYRGGGGRTKGAWRPNTTTCIMHKGREFCTVCREALVLKIYKYVDPIDGARPTPPLPGAQIDKPKPERDGRYAFEVDLVQPASHGLEVQWFVFAEQNAPKCSNVREADRTKRGPLATIKDRPVDRDGNWSKSKHRFLWRPDDDAKGRYLVVCRVKDHTKVSAERLPWVLEDPQGVLESERCWWVEL